MTKLRVALTALTIAGWFTLLGTMVWDGHLKADRYLHEHHCVSVDGSALWTYVQDTCPGCPPVSVTEDTYQCDGGEWVQR